MDPEAAEVKAAGGVVWRRGDRGIEVALVHRPRYDDWSFPKGKLDAGESWEDGALREVEEEIGLRCRLGHELPHTSYRDPKGRAKVVRYWMMEPLDGEFVPSNEVDEMRWLPTVGGRAAAQLRARPGAAARGQRVNRDRFPGLRGGWARLDGPAGTQMVDGAIEAMAEFMRSGHNANHGGLFEAAHRTDELVASARASVGTLLGGDPRGVAFGPSMTAMTMRFSAAAGRALEPGDEIVLQPARPRRQRAAVADRRRARRRHRPLRRPRARDARAAGLGRRGGAHRPHPLGRRHRRLQRGRHRARPAGHRRRRPRRRRARVRRRRPRRAAPPARRRGARLRRAGLLAPTSGSGRTSGSCGAGPSCSRSSSRTSCGPRPTRRRTAGSSARCRSSRWPACAPPPTTCCPPTGRPSARTRTRCSPPRSTG